MTIEYACAERAFGEPAQGVESGDLYLVTPFRGGVLVAVIDGLGHGTQAALAARAAASVLRNHPAESLDRLVRRCHTDLARTRGVAMSLARFDSQASLMTWTGVGNVEALLIRQHTAAIPPQASLTLRGGVVGYQVPEIRPATVTVAPGDTLIMATDGIRHDFTHGIDLGDSPRYVADSILARHGRYTDDALVLVVRYIGGTVEQQSTPELSVGQGLLPSDPRDWVATVAGLEFTHQIMAVREEMDVVIARTSARDFALRNGLSVVATEALATGTSEIARNIILHATAGEILLGTLRESDRRGVVVVAHDCGPGISNVALAMQEGRSSPHGLGLGLSSARRLADEFDLVTAPGKGTTVILKKWLA